MKKRIFKQILGVAFISLFYAGTVQAATKPLDYAPGQLVVKVKPGKSLAELQNLNSKYEVISSEPVFKDFPTPQSQLKELKSKLSNLESKSHANWFWQLDKNSKEYKDYLKRIEKDKALLQAQIKATEEFVKQIENMDKIAPAGVTAPKLDNIYLLKTNSTVDMSKMVIDYAASPLVEYAEPNYSLKLRLLPNDHYYPLSNSWGQGYDDLWALKRMDCEHAWDITQGEGVIVGVVDSGLDYNHPDIWKNVWINPAVITDKNLDGKIDLDDCDENGDRQIEPFELRNDMLGKNFINYSNDPKDDAGHGTFMAGLIAASGNNSLGITGVAYKAKILSIKVFNSDGFGYNVDCANGILYAVTYGAKVINNSWGEEGYKWGRHLIRDAIDTAYARGRVVVVAAGNDNLNINDNYPTTLPNIIAVSSTNYEDNKSDFSSWGYNVDLAAPGGSSSSNDILSLLATDTYSGDQVVDQIYLRAAGSSASAAYVSGVAALVSAAHPTFTNEQVRQALRISAQNRGDPGFDKYYGWGRINALAAVQANSVCAAKILSPNVYDIVSNNTVIRIEGIAYGTNFSNYKLEYRNILSDSWQLISTEGFGSNPVLAKGLLGNWSTYDLAAGEYQLKLTVYDNQNRMFQDIVGGIYVQPVHTGWPLYGREGSGFRGSLFRYTSPFIVADVNKDGRDEIVTAQEQDKAINIYRDNGRIEASIYLGLDNRIISDIVCTDLDKDGDLEICFVTENTSRSAAVLNCYHHDGWMMDGLPLDIEYDDISDFYALSSADMDNDTYPDLIVMPSSPNYNMAMSAKIYKLFPVVSVLAEMEGSSETVKRGSGFAVADINKDNIPELFVPVIGQDNKAYLTILNYNSSPWNIKTLPLANITANTDSGVAMLPDKSRPIVADLDKDGNLEIIYSAVYPGVDSVNFSKLFAWSYDNGEYTNLFTNDILGETTGLAVGDIDADNNLEIVYGIRRATPLDIGGVSNICYTNVVCATKKDGTKLDETINDQKWIISDAAPVIGEVNGDGKKEIVMHGINLLTGFAQVRTFGYINVTPSYVVPTMELRNLAKYEFPVFGQKENLAPVALGHLDNSRNVRLVFLNQQDDINLKSGMIVWDSNTTYLHTAMDWPQFQHDPWRTGNHQANIQQYVLKGDINKDGDITGTDISLCANMVRNPPLEIPIEADMDVDGNIDFDDVVAIVRVTVGIYPNQPVFYPISGLLGALSAQQITAGSVLEYDIPALKLNPVDPKYSLISAPQGMSLNETTGRLTWKANNPGLFTAGVRIAYMKGGSGIYEDKELSINVLPASQGNISVNVYELRRRGWGWTWSRIIRGANVVAYDKNNVRYVAARLDNGSYQFNNLAAGDYRIVASRMGYFTASQNTVVRSDVTSSVNIGLRK